MNGKAENATRWSMLVVIEFDRSLFQHFNVSQWNEFVGILAKRGMTPVAWSKGERPPPIGVMLDFRGLRRAHYKLNGIDLTLCDLEGADFEGANLKGAKLGPCPRANLRNARLQGAEFRGDISGADFTGADFGATGADFSNASYDRETPPIGLPPEVLARCNADPAPAASDPCMPPVPPEQPLRACVTITEVPW